MVPTLSAEKLKKVCFEILKAAGAPEAEAETVSTLLVEANLHGLDSHGVLRLEPYVRGIEKKRIVPGAEIQVIKETSATLVLDGNWGFGQVICMKAMKMAIQKAKKTGISSVAVFNCNHIGRLADYSMLAARNDMICMTLVQAGPHGSMAPFGGKKAVMGTNPMCFAIPSGTENPVVLDMATSMVSGGAIRIRHARGEKVPEGWILDPEGKPTTNPADWIGPPKGISLPFGHKGYGLAVVIESLCGGLTGVGVGKEILEKFPNRSGINQVLIVVINVAAFAEVDKFKNHVKSLIKQIKAVPTQEGVDEIFLPGEPEFRAKERRLRDGIYVEEGTWNKVTALGEKLGVDIKAIVSGEART
jgi:uncharacterized oxidoreductase